MNFLKNILTRNSILLIFLFSFIFVYFISNVAVTSSPEIILVKSTESEDILAELSDRGLIQNKMTYYFLLLQSKFNNKIKRGGYVLSKNMTASALYSELKNPSYRYVAIIEGSRKEEVVEKYGRVLDWPEEKVQEYQINYPLCKFYGKEGRLYPGEYLVSADVSLQSIYQEMEENFEKTFQEIVPAEKGSSLDEEKLVIVASLIQRESGGKSDMRLISGIIWNRIFKGMPLQIDATLQYAKGNENLWWPAVNSVDKFLESPFNTYQIEGLPPTPISNPGKAALEAAANPISTDCLFYLHDKRGNIHCSSTYQGHLNNIEWYL